MPCREIPSLKRALQAALCLAIVAGGSPPTAAQSSGASIVDEALKGVEQDQARDAERVRRMVEEAVKGAEQAPSGTEAVNPAAPATLRPLPGDAPGALPVGYRAQDLIGQPVRDGAGAEIGKIRGLAVDDASGTARAMCELEAPSGQPGKVSAIAVETLVAAAPGLTGYVMDLPAVEIDWLPSYEWRDGMWRRTDA
jgi:hypothetical protein